MSKRKATIIVVFAAVFSLIMAAACLWCVKEQIDTTAKLHAEQALCEEMAHHIEGMKEAEASRTFDTSVLETWGKGYDQGKVRMVGAWLVSTDGQLMTVEDEQGERWLIDSVSIDEVDNIMLWIADNHTEDDVTDDEVVKVWKEQYN